MENPQNFVIATGKTNTLEDFVAAVFNTLGLNWQDHVISDSSLLRPSEIMVSIGDPSKAERILGWKAKYFMPDVARLMVKADSQPSGT